MATATQAPVFRVLSAGSEVHVPSRPGRADGELWLSTAELEQASGWSLKQEGLCRGEVCVPIPPEAASLVDGELVCASALWRRLGRPLLRDAAGSVWFLGEAAEDRARSLASLEAPDFTLPDIEGKLHSLSDFRGRKVFLATWASW